MSKEQIAPIDKLREVIAYPSRTVESTIGRIERKMNEFQDSAEADIQKLLHFDHQDRKTAALDREYRESLRNIHENQDVIIALIDMLRRTGGELAEPTIASLETLLDSVDDSLASHDYRKTNSLPSAMTQVENYITDLSDMRDKGEMAPEVVQRLQTQEQHLQNQMDLVEIYHLGEQEYRTLREILGPYFSLNEVLAYVNKVVELADPSQWNEKTCQNIINIIKALEKVQQLSLFKEQASVQLESLKTLLQQKMEETSGVELVMKLGEQANEIPPKASTEIEEIATLLEDLIFSPDALKNNGWIEIDSEKAKTLLAKAQAGKAKFSRIHLTDRLRDDWRTQKGRADKALRERQASFCDTVIDFVTHLSNSREEIKRLRPVADQLKLVAHYIQADKLSRADTQESDESAA